MIGRAPRVSWRLRGGEQLPRDERVDDRRVKVPLRAVSAVQFGRQCAHARAGGHATRFGLRMRRGRLFRWLGENEAEAAEDPRR